MKRVFGLLLVFVTCFLFSGCGKGNDKLTIFVWGQAHERAIYERIIEKFTEETGIEVDAQLVNQDGYAETLSAALGPECSDIFYANRPTSVPMQITESFSI